MSLADVEAQKRKLNVLILGAYRPNHVLHRLEMFQGCLIRRKFEMAKLVKDFRDDVRYDQDDDIHFTIKSRLLIENWAHVSIFVFFKEGDNLGVGNELSYTCLKLPMKISVSVAFLETNLDVGSQVKGTLKLGARDQKLSYENFENDKDLCNLAFGHCRKMLDPLFYYIGP